MRPSGRTDPLVREIQAALDGLATGPLQAAASPELVHEVLEHIGDALRARMMLARPFRNWLGTRTMDEVAAAVATARDELKAWVLPTRLDDEALPYLLLRRDCTASFQTGVGRWSIEHRTPTCDVSGFAELDHEVDAFDRRLANLTARSDVERLLGGRVRLLGSRGWTCALPEYATVDAEAPTNLPWDDAMADVPPSDEIVAQYIETGARATYVEGFATRVPDFADELRLLIEAACDAGETINIRLARWLKPRTGPPPTLHWHSVDAWASATESDAAAAPHSIQLGPFELPGTTGRVSAIGNELSLIVFAPRDALREVSFGEVLAAPPVDYGSAGGKPISKWVATVRRGRGPFLIRLTASDGRVFEPAVIAEDSGG